MKVTINTADGCYLTIKSMPDDDIVRMMEEVRSDDDGWVVIILDDKSSVQIRIRQIVSVELDPEEDEGNGKQGRGG